MSRANRNNERFVTINETARTIPAQKCHLISQNAMIGQYGKLKNIGFVNALSPRDQATWLFATRLAALAGVSHWIGVPQCPNLKIKCCWLVISATSLSASVPVASAFDIFIEVTKSPGGKPNRGYPLKQNSPGLFIISKFFFCPASTFIKFTYPINGFNGS